MSQELLNIYHPRDGNKFKSKISLKFAKFSIMPPGRPLTINLGYRSAWFIIINTGWVDLTVAGVKNFLLTCRS